VSQVTRRQQWKRRSRSSGLLRVVFVGYEMEGAGGGREGKGMVLGVGLIYVVFWRMPGFSSSRSFSLGRL
jgi:hypothetical protein